MHIQASVLGSIENARRHEQPERYRDDQVDRAIWSDRGLHSERIGHIQSVRTLPSNL